MILLDPSERRNGSTCPRFVGEQLCDWLESFTGADMALSAYDDVPCEKLAHLEEHLRRGAVLVQMKRGADLASSLGQRLDDSLARMCAVTARPAQRRLVITGHWYSDPSGYALLGGGTWVVASTTYAQICGALSKWNDRGGTVDTLPTDAYLPSYIALKLKHLAEYRDHPSKPVYPAQEAMFETTTPYDALQPLIRITDARVMLRALVGEQTALAVWEYAGKRLDVALQMLTDPDSVKYAKIPGIAAGTIAKVRARCGLAEGVVITGVQTLSGHWDLSQAGAVSKLPATQPEENAL